MGRSGAALLLNSFGEVELTNALQLRVFRKEIARAQAAAAYAAFQQDIGSGVLFVVPVAAAVFEKAKHLSRKHTATLGARTLDILHVAAALVSGAETFYTFDANQGRLAKAEGLAAH